MQIHPRNILGKGDKQLLDENLSLPQPFPLRSHIHIQRGSSILHIPPSALASVGWGDRLPKGGQHKGVVDDHCKCCPNHRLPAIRNHSG